MLPTKEASQIHCIRKNRAEFELQFKTIPFKTIKPFNGYHLYIVSDEEIKEGDWIMDTNNQPYQVQGKEIIKLCNSNKLIKSLNKIIATTDSSLIKEHDDTVPYPKMRNTGIYLIPQDFIKHYIKEYNKGNIITDVMVEYEEIPLTVEDLDYPDLDGEYRPDYKLKVNPKDNTITIHSVKNSWNREEVEDKLHQMCKWFNTDVMPTGFLSRTRIDKWIEENL